MSPYAFLNYALRTMQNVRIKLGRVPIDERES